MQGLSCTLHPSYFTFDVSRIALKSKNLQACVMWAHGAQFAILPLLTIRLYHWFALQSSFTKPYTSKDHTEYVW